MPPQPISLGIRSNPGRDKADGAARLINCYAEEAGEEGKIKYPIYASESYTAFSTLVESGTGECRAMIGLNDTTMYVVSGSRVNKVSSAGTASNLGLVSSAGRAYMARNRKEDTPQIGIVTSDGHYYVIENNALTEYAWPSVNPTLTSIGHMDGYFILTCANGDWYITSIDEANEIDDLEFATTEANSDGLIRAVTRGRDLMLVGSNSIEFWQNTGATDFPFERVSTINIGCFAADF
jgi:hypothetical protein